MKKKILTGAGVLSLCLAMGMSMAVMADSRKVVTLGADLTEQQEQMVLNYFGVSKDEVELLTINNQDEREHLSAYVPLEQIGTRTYSCAFVSPTTSGGIQVKTANLDWVTCNMIATTLSTSGVVNCDVVAASPIKVSGTGALTGIIMAYEEASGEQLDPEKKEIATQELVVTSNLASNVGQKQATAVVNEAKTQVIADNITNIDQIQTVINEAAKNQEVTIDDQQMDELLDLLDKISQEDYDYKEMADTLQRVEENVSDLNDKVDSLAASEKTEGQQEAAKDAAQQAESEAASNDSILNNTNEAALGEGVKEGSTLEPETDPVETEAPASESGAGVWEESTGSFGEDGQPSTEAVTSETGTEAVQPETSSTEAVSSETGTEAVQPETSSTEAVSSETGTEAVLPETTSTDEVSSETGTESAGDPSMETPSTDAAYTEESLVSEEDKAVFKKENWYFDKVLGIEASEEDLQDADYAQYKDIEVTVLPVSQETAEALKGKLDSFILKTMAEDNAWELGEEEMGEYGNAEIKAICEYLKTLFVDDGESLLTDVPAEVRQAAADEAKDALKKIYNLSTEEPNGALPGGETEETGMETQGTEQGQTEAVEGTESVFGEATTETFNAQ